MRDPKQRRLRQPIRRPELLAHHDNILRVAIILCEDMRNLKLPAREVQLGEISQLEESLREHTEGCVADAPMPVAVRGKASKN